MIFTSGGFLLLGGSSGGGLSSLIRLGSGGRAILASDSLRVRRWAYPVAKRGAGVKNNHVYRGGEDCVHAVGSLMMVLNLLTESCSNTRLSSHTARILSTAFRRDSSFSLQGTTTVWHMTTLQCGTQPAHDTTGYVGLYPTLWDRPAASLADELEGSRENSGELQLVLLTFSLAVLDDIIGKVEQGQLPTGVGCREKVQ